MIVISITSKSRYAVVALAIILLIRPLLHLIGYERLFSHASIAEFSLYVAVLGTLVLFA